MALLTQEHTPHIQPSRVENLPYATMPDFPAIAELSVDRKRYVHLTGNQSRVLQIGEKSQVGMGDVKECTTIIIPATGGQAALAVHFSPDNVPPENELEAFRSSHAIHRAAILYGDRAGYTSRDAAGWLAAAGLSIIDIPLTTDQYIHAFFDLGTMELSIIGRNLVPDGGDSSQLQLVVYEPFAAS